MNMDDVHSLRQDIDKLNGSVMQLTTSVGRLSEEVHTWRAALEQKCQEAQRIRDGLTTRLTATELDAKSLSLRLQAIEIRHGQLWATAVTLAGAVLLLGVNAFWKLVAK